VAVKSAFGGFDSEFRPRGFRRNPTAALNLELIMAASMGNHGWNCGRIAGSPAGMRVISSRALADVREGSETMHPLPVAQAMAKI